SVASPDPVANRARSSAEYQGGTHNIFLYYYLPFLCYASVLGGFSGATLDPRCFLLTLPELLSKMAARKDLLIQRLKRCNRFRLSACALNKPASCCSRSEMVNNNLRSILPRAFRGISRTIVRLSGTL